MVLTARNSNWSAWGRPPRTRIFGLMRVNRFIACSNDILFGMLASLVLRGNCFLAAGDGTFILEAVLK